MSFPYLRRLLVASTVPCSLLLATPVAASCGKPDPSDGVSEQALKMVNEWMIRKATAERQIDEETMQAFLGRSFDVETGKLRDLPPKLAAQYKKDALYFIDIIKEDANKKLAYAQEIMDKALQPCPSPKK